MADQTVSDRPAAPGLLDHPADRGARRAGGDRTLATNILLPSLPQMAAR